MLPSGMEKIFHITWRKIPILVSSRLHLVHRNGKRDWVPPEGSSRSRQRGGSYVCKWLNRVFQIGLWRYNGTGGSRGLLRVVLGKQNGNPDMFCQQKVLFWCIETEFVVLMTEVHSQTDIDQRPVDERVARWRAHPSTWTGDQHTKILQTALPHPFPLFKGVLMLQPPCTVPFMLPQKLHKATLDDAFVIGGGADWSSLHRGHVVYRPHQISLPCGDHDWWGVDRTNTWIYITSEFEFWGQQHSLHLACFVWCMCFQTCSSLAILKLVGFSRRGACGGIGYCTVHQERPHYLDLLELYLKRGLDIYTYRTYLQFSL